MASRMSSANSLGQLDSASGGRSHVKGLPSDVSILSFGIGGSEDERTTPPISPAIARRRQPVPVASQNTQDLTLNLTDYAEEDTEAYRAILLDLSFWVVERKTTLCAAQLVTELQALILVWKAQCPLMAMDSTGNGAGAGNGKTAQSVSSAPGSFLAQAGGLLFGLCQRYEVETQPVLAAAVRTLGLPVRHLPIAALLVHMLDRPSTLNILLRQSVRKVLHRCSLASKALMGCEVLTREGTALSPSLRQELVNLVWDLELCLFLHLEGSLKLSRRTILEMTVGARVALLLISWRLNYTALHLLISHPPHTNLVADGSAQSLEEEEAPPPTPKGTSEMGAAPQSPNPSHRPMDRGFSDDLDDCSEDEDEGEEVDPLTSLATTVADINRAEDSKGIKKGRRRDSSAAGSEKQGRRRRRSSASSAASDLPKDEKSRGASLSNASLPSPGMNEGSEDEKRRGGSFPSAESETGSRKATEGSKGSKKTFSSASDLHRLRGLSAGSHEHKQVIQVSSITLRIVFQVMLRIVFVLLVPYRRYLSE